jgi:hypothetical protein
METHDVAILDRLLNEPARAFRAFCIYRDVVPTRSLWLVDEALHPQKRAAKGL